LRNDVAGRRRRLGGAMRDADSSSDSEAARRTSRPALTAARERELLHVARTADDPAERLRATEELLEHHMHLVTAIAGRDATAVANPRILIEAGYMALRRAVDEYQPESDGARLAGHAVPLIRRSVEEAVARDGQSPPGTSGLGYRQVTRMGPRLLRDARRDCAREGVRATDTELIGRVARRVGLPFSTAAALLSHPMPAWPPSADDRFHDNAKVSRLDLARARRRLAVLAETILGFRERVVFLARCPPNVGTPVSTAQLARRLGVKPGHVSMIEASARRKIATAGWVEGLTGVNGTGGGSGNRTRRADRP
jgi:hypothetical protein